MEFRQLSHFVAVAEEHSFTQAARRANIVQSGISASIGALERELGVTLFNRSKHRVELTDARKALLGEARRALAALAAARVAATSGRQVAHRIARHWYRPHSPFGPANPRNVTPAP